MVAVALAVGSGRSSYGANAVTELVPREDRAVWPHDERWLDNISYSEDPWHDWTRRLGFPRVCSSRDAGLERAVENIIADADLLRIATTPRTPRFAASWLPFRQHHEKLDDNSDYRRSRFLCWRLAALTVLHERAVVRDVAEVIDRVRAKLIASYNEFSIGAFEPDGSYDCGRGNFWRPRIANFDDGTQGPDPLGEYAAMVLLLVRVVTKKGGVR
jgi:hypothetical protein